MKLNWEADAWNEYVDWQQLNKDTLRRINQLIKDIQRQPFTGIGKPERNYQRISSMWRGLTRGLEGVSWQTDAWTGPLRSDWVGLPNAALVSILMA